MPHLLSMLIVNSVSQIGVHWFSHSQSHGFFLQKKIKLVFRPAVVLLAAAEGVTVAVVVAEDEGPASSSGFSSWKKKEKEISHEVKASIFWFKEVKGSSAGRTKLMSLPLFGWWRYFQLECTKSRHCSALTSSGRSSHAFSRVCLAESDLSKK